MLPSLGNVTKNDIASFWVEVLHFTDASGERCFKELAEFALSLLSLPLSNADVEHVLAHELGEIAPPK